MQQDIKDKVKGGFVYAHKWRKPKNRRCRKSSN